MYHSQNDTNKPISPTDQPREIVFIINPRSGTQSKERVVELIHQHLDPEKFKIRIEFTQRPAHATQLAWQAASDRVAYVIAVGGDGTMNEVARALVHSPTALGILPMGSGNGLARHLQIPIDTVKALQRINQERCITIDTCTLNGKPFFCTAGVGFDAYIGRVFSMQKTRGFGTYLRTAVQEFFGYQPTNYRLNWNGKTIEKKAFVISFANAAQYGNNAFIAPGADISDGLMDISIIRPFPVTTALGIGVRLFGKTLHLSPYVDTIRTNEITVTSDAPHLIHVDGEPFEVDDQLTVKLKPLSLKVLV